MDTTEPTTTAPTTTAPTTTAPTTTAPAATTAPGTVSTPGPDTSARPGTAPATTTAPGRSGAVRGAAGPRRPAPDRSARRRHLQLVGATGAGDAGMATAEYAIATLAACGFAALLVAILGGGEVRGMLLSLVERALSVV